MRTITEPLPAEMLAEVTEKVFEEKVVVPATAPPVRKSLASRLARI
jgi:hypothetical protein